MDEQQLRLSTVFPHPPSEDITRRLRHPILGLATGSGSTDSSGSSDSSDLRALFKVTSFEPGQAVYDYQVPSPLATQSVPFCRQTNAHIVLAGRVRVLCQNQQRELPYSASLLGAGDIFGIDHRLFAAPLSYQVVAASSCRIAQVPWDDLNIWLDLHPCLKDYWRRRMQQRAQQIFFKQFTPFRVWPSTTLTKLLLSQIEEQQVAVGKTLKEDIVPYEGWFWLRSGCLELQQRNKQAVPIGSSWSSRQSLLADGVARTPLRLFQLPPQSTVLETVAHFLDQR